MQNAAAFFPLCALEKTAFSSAKCPSMHCGHGQVCSRCWQSLPHKVRHEKKQHKSMSSTYTFARAHNVDGYIGKNTHAQKESVS